MYDNDEIIEHKLSHLRPHCQMYDLQNKKKGKKNTAEEVSNLNGDTQSSECRLQEDQVQKKKHE